VIGSRCNGGSSEAAPSDSYLGQGSWQISFGYRHQLSHRHFVGTEEQHERGEQNTEIINNINLFDVGLTYAFTPRYNLTVSVPFLVASRLRPGTLDRLRGIPDAPDQVFHTAGIGDISVTGRMWIIRPPAEDKQNISIGVGLKLPTGAKGAKDTVLTPAGRVTQVVDQSIQPGDGGWGMTLDMQAFKVVGKATLFASGVYLVNPQNMNGVKTGRARPSEAVMSVADQYVVRMGAVLPFPKVSGLSFSVGARGEGVPARDILGKSDGFRRPGYAIDFDPAFIYSKGRDTWAFGLPVPVRRNRIRSVPDIRDNRHGDAAFADYVILVGYSHCF